MTPEELLKPRYKVIADYPGNDTPIGTIHDNEFIIRFHEKILNSYPHLFKKLEWWEERKESDMPEYVKDENRVVSFIEMKFIADGDYLPAYWWGSWHISCFLPATKEEYLNQPK